MRDRVIAGAVLEGIAIASADSESLDEALVDKLFAGEEANALKVEEATEVEDPDLGIDPSSLAPTLIEGASTKVNRSPRPVAVA